MNAVRMLFTLVGGIVGGIVAHMKFRKAAGGVLVGGACAVLLVYLFGPAPATVVAVVNGQDDFHEQVLSNPKPVLVDFYADWCNPCRKLSPIIDELAVQYDGRVKVVKIDVESSRLLARDYNVRGIPVTMLFVNGKMVKRINGLHPKSDYVFAIEAVLKRRRGDQRTR